MNNIILYIDEKNACHIIDDVSQIDNIKISIAGEFNFLKISYCKNFKNCRINIKSNYNNVEIKDSKCLITFNAEIHGGSHQNLYIGRNFSSGLTNFLMTEPFGDITIQDNCMFSSDIVFLNSDSHCIFNENNTLINDASGITIHDHVWIGRGVRILKNAEIESNSIVGAYSVVAKKFKRKNIAIGGNPAKEIASNIFWDREAIYKYFKRTNKIKQDVIYKHNSKIELNKKNLKDICQTNEYKRIEKILDNQYVSISNKIIE